MLQRAPGCTRQRVLGVSYEGSHWQAVGGQGQARDSDSESSRSADAYGEEDEAWVEEHVSAEDEAALAAFLKPGSAGQQQRTLSDIILSKIRERQATGDVAFTAECALELQPLFVCPAHCLRNGVRAEWWCAREGEGLLPPGQDPKVVEVYTAVGKILSRYSAGKIPKAFKVVPTLKNWEEARHWAPCIRHVLRALDRQCRACTVCCGDHLAASACHFLVQEPRLYMHAKHATARGLMQRPAEQVLYLTDPEHWSPHAVYQATRLFVSSLNARLAQRFLALVLLPHVRQDIREHRRLHFALFQAMKKAAYKPDAFYKARCPCGRYCLVVGQYVSVLGSTPFRLSEVPRAGMRTPLRSLSAPGTPERERLPCRSYSRHPDCALSLI